MTFSVIWRLTALQQLGQIRAAASDPVAVDRAAAFMDYMLRRVPRDMGEGRSPGFRLWYEDVLGVFYRVDEINLRVDILFVAPARRP